MENDWGKTWTYLVLSIIWIVIGSVVYALVEMRRDSDARNYYKAAKANQRQIEDLRAYVWADTTATADRNALKIMLREYVIIRTRAQVDSLQQITDSIAQAERDLVEAQNIIDSVFVANENTTWMSVMVRSQVKCQAVARYGTLPGIYTGAGVMEESFNYDNHSLRIGNAEPLEPGTKYYIQVEATDQNGNVYFSKEITGETLQE